METSLTVVAYEGKHHRLRKAVKENGKHSHFLQTAVDASGAKPCNKVFERRIEVLLNRAFGKAEPLRHLGLCEPFEAMQSENVLRTGRQFFQC